MKRTTEAKLKGSLLTVGFYSAKSPLIWRFDLERNHSFTFSLQGDEGDWELGVTSLKGDFSSVAHFDEREDAEDALAVVEKTLSSKWGGTALVLKAVAWVAVIAIVVFFSAGLFSFWVAPHPASTLIGKTTAPAAVQKGVPLSADDVLQPPR